MKKTSNPLFIPLKTQHYNGFKYGLKTHEMRHSSKRWNRRTCFPGRQVVLSKGYGNYDRLHGEIVSVDMFPAHRLSEDEYQDFIDCYGEPDGLDERMVIYLEIRING